MLKSLRSRCMHVNASSLETEKERMWLYLITHRSIRSVLQFTANEIIIVSYLFKYSADKGLEVVTVIEQNPIDKRDAG